MSEFELGYIILGQNDATALTDSTLHILILIARNHIFESICRPALESHTKLLVPDEPEIKRMC